MFRFEGRAWKRCEPEIVPTLLKLKGIQFRRLRRGRTLPLQGQKHELFLLMTVEKPSRQLLSGMPQFIAE